MEVALDRVSAIYRRYGQEIKALADVTLVIPDGQWLLIGGHNGSGKSTLLKLLAGRVSLSEGLISLDGRASTDFSRRDRARILFYLEQDPAAGTAGCLSVRETLMLADAEARKWMDRARTDTYNSLLDDVGMRHRLDHPVDALSGGERQLLAILVTRLRNVKLLLLDEPTSALDDHRARAFICSLRSLAESRCTIIMVSHSVTDLTNLGERTILLRGGSIAYDKAANRNPEEIQRIVAPMR